MSEKPGRHRRRLDPRRLFHRKSNDRGQAPPPSQQQHDRPPSRQEHHQQPPFSVIGRPDMHNATQYPIPPLQPLQPLRTTAYQQAAAELRGSLDRSNSKATRDNLMRLQLDPSHTAGGQNFHHIALPLPEGAAPAIYSNTTQHLSHSSLYDQQPLTRRPSTPRDQTRSHPQAQTTHHVRLDPLGSLVSPIVATTIHDDSYHVPERSPISAVSQGSRGSSNDYYSSPSRPVSSIRPQRRPSSRTRARFISRESSLSHPRAVPSNPSDHMRSISASERSRPACHPDHTWGPIDSVGEEIAFGTGETGESGVGKHPVRKDGRGEATDGSAASVLQGYACSKATRAPS